MKPKSPLFFKTRNTRSDKKTEGLCNTFRNFKEIRTFFYELDTEMIQHLQKVKDVYERENLDYMIHRTGSKGYHFLSPTIITKKRWIRLMRELKDVNPKCPMTTLRTEPNKYPNESESWYRFEKFEGLGNIKFNSLEMCQYLFKIFRCHFQGLVPTELKIVHYPLP